MYLSRIGILFIFKIYPLIWYEQKHICSGGSMQGTRGPAIILLERKNRRRKRSQQAGKPLLPSLSQGLDLPLTKNAASHSVILSLPFPSPISLYNRARHILYLNTVKTSDWDLDLKVGVQKGQNSWRLISGFLKLIKDLLVLKSDRRLFHKCAPLQQKLLFKISVRVLGKANLFSIFLVCFSGTRWSDHS